MSLKDPQSKMSKSDLDPRSRIQLDDDPELISDKIRLALTDSVTGVSYDLINRPGISNLLAMMSYLDPERRPIRELEHVYRSATMRNFKAETASIIINALAPIRDEYRRLIDAKSTRYLDDIVAEGSAKARTMAQQTISMIRQTIGLT